MKDENGYYGRRLRQAYDEGYFHGMVYTGAIFITITILVWVLASIG